MVTLGRFNFRVPLRLYATFRSFSSDLRHYFKENDNTLKFAKHVSTETSVIFS